MCLTLSTGWLGKKKKTNLDVRKSCQMCKYTRIFFFLISFRCNKPLMMGARKTKLGRVMFKLMWSCCFVFTAAQCDKIEQRIRSSHHSLKQTLVEMLIWHTLKPRVAWMARSKEVNSALIYCIVLDCCIISIPLLAI